MERPDTIDLETATRDTIEEVSKIFSIGCPCDGEIGQKTFQVTMTFFASCVFNRNLSAEHVKVGAWHLTCLTI